MTLSQQSWSHQTALITYSRNRWPPQWWSTISHLNMHRHTLSTSIICISHWSFRRPSTPPRRVSCWCPLSYHSGSKSPHLRITSVTICAVRVLISPILSGWYQHRPLHGRTSYRRTSVGSLPYSHTMDGPHSLPSIMAMHTPVPVMWLGSRTHISRARHPLWIHCTLSTGIG